MNFKKPIILFFLFILVFTGVVCVSAANKKLQAEPKTESKAGRDSTVWNITFQDVTNKVGYTLPICLGGWFLNRRRLYRALDNVIESIEQKECIECKHCVASKYNMFLDKRTQIVSARIKLDKNNKNGTTNN